MSRLRVLHDRRHDDAGAFAIMYAAVILVFLGMAGLVLDLAALRVDRRAERLAADAASTAAALRLSPTVTTGGAPRAACREAVAYLNATLDGAGGLSDGGCTAFPDLALLPCSNNNTTTVPMAAGRHAVQLTWPVPNGHPLMAGQADDAVVDGAGEERCGRFGVRIVSERQFTFARALGFSSGTTTGRSVARVAIRDEEGDDVAALNVLHPTSCQAIVTSGQGSVVVQGSEADRVGLIAIESSGRPSGPASTCPNSTPYVLDPSPSGNSVVQANGPLGAPVGGGQIRMFALSPGQNNAQAFRPTTVIQPYPPTALNDRQGSTPVTKRYQTHVDALVSAIGNGGPPSPYAPYGSQPFTTLPDPAFPSFSCSDSPGNVAVLPAGNYLVNCPTLSVSGTVVFLGASGVNPQIVFAGGISTGSQGCLAVNVATAACSSGLDPDAVDAAAVSDAVVYMRGNGSSFSKGAQSALFLPRTFVYQRDGSISFGAGSGTLQWSAPRPPAAQTDNCSDVPCQARFGKLALWSASGRPQSLGGQTRLGLAGVIFTPESVFSYSGQPTQNQFRAQFWASRLSVGGQSGLLMAADAKVGIPRQFTGTVLIR